MSKSNATPAAPGTQPPQNAATKPEKPRRPVDPELQAMSRISNELAGLTPEQTRRILGWLMQKFEAKMYPDLPGSTPANTKSRADDSPITDA